MINPSARIAVVGSGIAGLGSAWLLQRQGHAVTLFEADATPRRPLAHGQRDVGRRHRVGRYRVPRIQRAHVPAAHRALRRTRGGERRVSEMSFSVRVDAPATRMGRHRPCRAVRAAAQRAAAGILADARRHRCASTATTTVMIARDAVRSITSARTSTAAATRRPFATGTCCRWRRRSGRRRDATDARLSAADVRALLSQPRPARDRPTGRSGARWPAARASMSTRSWPSCPTFGSTSPVLQLHPAHGRGRRDRLAGAAPSASTHVVLACHSDQALRFSPAPSSLTSARCWAPGPLPAEPRRAAHRHALLPRAGAPGRLGITSRTDDADRRKRPVVCQLPASTGCSRCRSRRR